jgi:TP901 family phage tail tape measure protein
VSDGNLADLIIAFTAVNAPALEAFAQVSAAGEAMVAAVTTSVTEVNAAMREIGVGAGTAATEVAAAQAEIVASNQRVIASYAEVAAASAESSAAQAGANGTLVASIDAVIAEEEKRAASAQSLAAQRAAAAKEVQAAEAQAMAAIKANIESTVAAQQGLGPAVEKSAAEVEAANAKLIQSYLSTSNAAKLSAEQQAGAYAAMKGKIAADLAAVEGAAATAAASTATVGTTMAGTAASMGTLSNASASAKASFAGVAGAAGLTSKQLMLAGAGAGVVAGASVKMAGDFQMSTQRLVSSAGEVDRNLGMVRDGILKMAGEVGYSSEQLSKAMYTIESGGQHGAEGLKVLKAAAEGAKTENAELKTVADSVTSVLQDYHLKADDAAMVTSKLVAATASGKTTFEELSGSMAAVLPVASANHVALDDVLGSMASMTVHGMSARQAAQNLTDTIRHMAAPTQVQAKELAALGINSQKLAGDLGEKGLYGVLKQITDQIEQRMPGAKQVVLDMNQALSKSAPPVQELGKALMEGSISQADYMKTAKGMDPIMAGQAMSFATLVKGMHQLGTEQVSGAQAYQSYAGALQKATGDATGLNVALMLTGENSKTTEKAIGAVGKATTEAGGHVAGWQGIEKTFNQQMAETKSSLGSLAIQIGTVLLPVVTAMGKGVAEAAKFMAEHKTAAVALAVVIGGVLVLALSAAAVAAWSFTAAMLANPIVWIVAAVVVAVGLLVALVVVIVQHWGQITAFFVGVWNAIKHAFETSINWIVKEWHKLGDLVGKAVDWFKELPGKIGDAISGLASKVGGWLKGVGEKLLEPFKQGWENIKKIWSMSPEEFGRFIGLLIGGAVRQLIQWGLDMVAAVKHAAENVKNGVIQLGHDIENGFNATIAWFKALPGKIKDALVNAKDWIADKATEMWNGFTAAVAAAWHNTLAWLKSVPGMIKEGYHDAKEWLAKTASDLWHGFLEWCKSAWTSTVQWFKDLPKNIKDFYKDAKQWLLQTGKDIWNGLVDGLKSAWDSVVSAIGGFIKGLIDGFKKGLGISSPSTVFLQFGKDIFQGLLNGLTNMWNTVNGWLGGIPGKVLAFYANAGQWLINAGKAILEGLLSGLKSAWSKVTGFVGGIGKWISDNKGPVEKDAVLLNPHGEAILQGLQGGMATGNTQLQQYVSQIPTQIVASFANSSTLLVQSGTNLMVGFQQGLAAGEQQVMGDVTAWVQSFLQSFYAAFGTANGSSSSTVFTQIGTNLMAGFKTGLDTAAEVALTDMRLWAGTTMLNVFYTAWGMTSPTTPSTVFTNIGQYLMTSFKTGWDTQTAIMMAAVTVWASTTFLQVFYQAWGMTSPTTPSTVFNQIGVSLMQGLANGITAGTPAAVAAAQASAAAVTAATKAATGVQSPSWITHEIGQHYVQGLVNGITDSQHKADRAAREMSRSLVGATQFIPKQVLAAAGFTGDQSGGGRWDRRDWDDRQGYDRWSNRGEDRRGGDQHFHVTVNGHVWRTQDLVREMQTELVRAGMRNPTNGSNYLGFNRGRG